MRVARCGIDQLQILICLARRHLHSNAAAVDRKLHEQAGLAFENIILAWDAHGALPDFWKTLPRLYNRLLRRAPREAAL